MKVNLIFFAVFHILFVSCGIFCTPRNEVSEAIVSHVEYNVKEYFYKSYYRMPVDQNDYMNFLRYSIEVYSEYRGDFDFSKIDEVVKEKEFVLIKKYGYSVVTEYTLLKQGKLKIDFLDDKAIIHSEDKDYLINCMPILNDSIVVSDYFPVRMIDKKGKIIDLDFVEEERLLHDIYIAKTKVAPNGIFRPMIVKYSRKEGLDIVYISKNFKKENFKSLSVVSDFLRDYLDHHENIEEIIVPMKNMW
ncbi:MAG: hypothetical protein MJZ34_15125 [Paludibacteraceae bacterium]|nr:hypothetical protein [Paludibacteraceae bacterium]